MAPFENRRRSCRFLTRAGAAGRAVYASSTDRARTRCRRGWAGADDFLWRPVSEGRVLQLHAAASARFAAEAAAERPRCGWLAGSCGTPCLAVRPGGFRRSRLWSARPGRRIVPPEGRVGNRERRSGARLASAFAARRPRGSPTSRRASRRDLASCRPGRLSFLPNVEATPRVSGALLAQVEGPRPTRFLVAIDEDPREALEAGRCSGLSPAPCRRTPFICRRCASGRATWPCSRAASSTISIPP